MGGTEGGRAYLQRVDGAGAGPLQVVSHGRTRLKDPKDGAVGSVGEEEGRAWEDHLRKGGREIGRVCVCV